MDFLIFFFFFPENLPTTVINLNVSNYLKCLFQNAASAALSAPIIQVWKTMLCTVPVNVKCSINASLLFCFLSGELVPFTWDFRIVCTLTTKTISEWWERRWMECWSTQLLSMMCTEFSYASLERRLFSALRRAGCFPTLWWWSQKLLWNVWEKLLKKQIIFVFYISNLQITVLKLIMFMQKNPKIIFKKFLILNIPVNYCCRTRSVCPWSKL